MQNQTKMQKIYKKDEQEEKEKENMMKPNKIFNSIDPGRALNFVMSRFRFSISPVQIRELTLYTLLRPTPHIVIPVLGLFPQENYHGWSSRKRIYLLRKYIN